MKRMFKYAHHFQGRGIGGWDVSRVTNVEKVFFCATALCEDLSRWDVASVTNKAGVFGRGEHQPRGQVYST